LFYVYMSLEDYIAKRKKTADSSIPDVEEEIGDESEEEMTETMFTFDAFEQVRI
jgi:hypothetical protein